MLRGPEARWGVGVGRIVEGEADGSEGMGASTSAGGHPEQGSACPVCEGSTILVFVGLTVSTANDLPLLSLGSRCGRRVNRCTWMCSSNVFFTETGGRLDMTLILVLNLNP